MPRFTLHPGSWYAAEMFGDDISNVRHCSPIKVVAISPAQSGQRRFSLSFYHANYPEGVRDKVYTLQTLERGRQFILTRSIDHPPSRLLLICPITAPWLQQHFGMVAPDGDELERWLDAHL